MSLPPVTDAAGRPLDQVRLVGLAVRGHHGVFDHERLEGQDFLVDVVLHLDTRPAGRSDDLVDTVDYGALATGLAAVVRGEPVQLIEALAQRLAEVALADARVTAVDVAVHKPQAPIVEVFADVVVAVRRTRAEVIVDARPAAPVRAVLALGANLGDPAGTLAAAVADLDRTAGLRVLAVSPVMRTAPVGGPVQPDYLNAVLLTEVTLAPRELLEACQLVENRHGRERQIRWGARTLDIDLIDYAGLRVDTPQLQLPHPRAASRAFVLAPWAAIDPAARLPSGPEGLPVLELLAAAPDLDGVRPSEVVLAVAR